MGRKIASEQEARRCLSAAGAAGQAAGAWAREHGIDGRSLNMWRVNLERSTPSAVRLVELVPRPPKAVDARYFVRVGEMAIEVGDDFQEELVRVLRAC
jgi:hypothetical protein